jgi:hypothetical protein
LIRRDKFGEIRSLGKFQSSSAIVSNSVRHSFFIASNFSEYWLYVSAATFSVAKKSDLLGYKFKAIFAATTMIKADKSTPSRDTQARGAWVLYSSYLFALS